MSESERLLLFGRNAEVSSFVCDILYSIERFLCCVLILRTGLCLHAVLTLLTVLLHVLSSVVGLTLGFCGAASYRLTLGLAVVASCDLVAGLGVGDLVLGANIVIGWMVLLGRHHRWVWLEIFRDPFLCQFILGYNTPPPAKP